ncbi:hypothetical protein FRB95_004286 [Tulasnella sp. JGI-2019a]|nr:hypothetical protein FRB95_004286 [Tulasnella sp. JGI-2019a]
MSSSNAVASLKSRLIGTGGTPTERVKALLGLILGPSDKSLLPFIPRPIKLLVAFLFLLNWRSWPFIWHAKVFKAVFKLRLDKFLHARTVPDQRRWLGKISCVGGNPFEIVSTTYHYAGLDDSDYNGHLSNSCYAKACDSARMKAACEIFPAPFGDGSWLALGGSSYSFMREIPYGVNYEIKTTIGGWDSKWMYIVHHFVTYPTKKKSRSQTKAPILKLPDQGSDSHTAGFPSMATPSTPSLINTPARSSSPPLVSTPQRVPYKAPSTIPKYKIKSPLPEGALVHCVAISTYCFKAGRITVPPAVAFIAGGLGDPSKQRWFHVQGLRFNDQYPPTSNKRVLKNKMTEILRGGWKTDIVDGWEINQDTGVSTFWELGEYEERRDENMKNIFGGVQLGMTSLKQQEDWFPTI